MHHLTPLLALPALLSLASAVAIPEPSVGAAAPASDKSLNARSPNPNPHISPEWDDIYSGGEVASLALAAINSIFSAEEVVIDEDDIPEGVEDGDIFELPDDVVVSSVRPASSSSSLKPSTTSSVATTKSASKTSTTSSAVATNTLVPISTEDEIDDSWADNFEIVDENGDPVTFDDSTGYPKLGPDGEPIVDDEGYIVLFDTKGNPMPEEGAAAGPSTSSQSSGADDEEDVVEDVVEDVETASTGRGTGGIIGSGRRPTRREASTPGNIRLPLDHSLDPGAPPRAVQADVDASQSSNSGNTATGHKYKVKPKHGNTNTNANTNTTPANAAAPVKHKYKAVPKPNVGNGNTASNEAGNGPVKHTTYKKVNGKWTKVVDEHRNMFSHPV